MKALSCVVFLWALTALSAERPKLPGPGVDEVLLEGKTPEVFFSQRVKSCSGLEQRRAEYLQEKATLKALQAQGASASSLESQSEKLEDALEVWIARVKDCGPCHIRPIRQVKVASAGKTENWFISDGSCYLPELTADQAARAFKIRRESLEKVAMYETQTGGFRQVVEFFPVHPATGRPSNVATLPNPYEAFIAVRGPVLFGVRTSAGYYFGGGFRHWTDGEGEHYYSHFAAKRPPRGFREPRITERDVTGKVHRVRVIALNDAQGQWYLNDKGYLRYHTAADFGLSLKFLSDMAESTLLETLLDMSERGTPE